MQILRNFFIVLMVFAVGWAQGIYYLEQETRIQNPYQQGSKTTLQKIWYTKDKMRTEEPQATTIIRLDLNKIWVLNPAEKTYMEMGIEELEAMGKMALGMLGNAENMTPRITRTKNTKKVGPWKAYELQIVMGPITQHIWISHDVDFPLEYYKQTLKAMPSLKQISDILEQEVDGIPVYTESTMEMMGTKIASTTELKKVEKISSLPADFFDLPDGYVKKLNPIQQMKQRMPGGQ